MKPMISISHLCKSYGTVKAVQDLSFTVQPGELFAFLGVNGAGKSTTITMLCGQLKKDSGTIRIDDLEFEQHATAIQAKIGVVFQNSVLDKALSVQDNLAYRAALYGITGAAFRARLTALTELLSFADLLKRPVGKLSGGQRRRIDIARALLHEPKLLILDEPTTGLDPQTRKTVWSAIDTLRKTKELTVFLTTHYMEEAADADHVVILEQGRIAAEGTPLQLKNQYTGDYITLYHATQEQLAQLQLPPDVCETIHDAVRIAVPNTAAATALIVAHPAIFMDYEITKGKMDDVFLAVTGKSLVGGNEK